MTPADPLALPRVPPSAPSRHRRRDVAAYVLFVVAITAMGIGAFRPQASATLDAENRPLAPWPAWSLNRGFVTAFERAFADRFGGRELLLRLHNRVLVRVFGVSPAPNVLIGNDGWLFFKGEDGRAFDRYYRGTQPVADAELQRIIDELRRREHFLAAHGIGYVVTVAPDKATIYPEHLPTWITHMRAPTPLERTAELLKRDPALHFVDLREPLLEAKRSRQVYYRTDSHWNYLGAIVAYEAIMNEVQRVVGVDRLPRIAPPDVPPYVEGVDRYRGDLARLLGIWTGYEEPDFAPFAKVLGDPSRRCARRIDHDDDPGFEIYVCDRAPALRAVVYRDSMAIPLIPLLSENFRRVVYVSSRRLDRSLIEREHPDVVIDEFVERNLHVTAAFPMSP